MTVSMLERIAKLDSKSAIKQIRARTSDGYCRGTVSTKLYLEVYRFTAIISRNLQSEGK